MLALLMEVVLFVALVLAMLVHFFFTLLASIVKVYVLLLNKLLQLVDLLTVKVDSHLVGGGNQVGVDLHLNLLFVFTVFVFVFLVFVVIVVGTLLLVLLVHAVHLLVFFVVDSALVISVDVLLVHYPLLLQLIFAHLVELVFLVVAVCHDSCDLVNVVILVVRLLVILLLQLLLIYLLSCGNRVLQVD